MTMSPIEGDGNPSAAQGRFDSRSRSVYDARIRWVPRDTGARQLRRPMLSYAAIGKRVRCIFGELAGRRSSAPCAVSAEMRAVIASQPAVGGTALKIELDTHCT